MDFDKFDKTFSGEESTVLVKMVGDAISADLSESCNKKVSRLKFNKWIDDAYNLRNANALRYGHAIGNKIIQGLPLAKGNSYIKGSDLAKIIYYCLHDLGHFEWNRLKAVVDLNLRLRELLNVKPLESQDVSKKIRKRVSSDDFGKYGFSASLRELALEIEPLELFNFK